MAELAARYEVDPRQIQAWTKVLKEGTAEVFSNGRDREAKCDAVL